MAFSSGTFTFTSNSFAPTPVAGTTISDTAATATWSELAAGLSTCWLKDGSQTVTANIPMAGFKFTGLGAGTAAGNSLRYEQIFNNQGTVVAASTTNLDTSAAWYQQITGTTTITAITLANGEQKTVEFEGILTLTNGASLILPGSANITTAAGDTAIFVGEASSVVRCIQYTQANGKALVAPFAASTGTFTATITGMTATITATAVYSITNNVVTLFLPATLTGTSNSTATTITGAPAAITPATNHQGFAITANDNGAPLAVFARADVASTGTITLFPGANGGNWTNSGGKGLNNGATITYNLN